MQTVKHRNGVARHTEPALVDAWVLPFSANQKAENFGHPGRAESIHHSLAHSAMHLCRFSLALVLALLAVHAEADSGFVDLFETVGVVTTSTSQPGGSWSFVSGGDIVGSERDVSIQIVSGPANSFASAGVGTAGVFSVHTDIEVGATFLVRERTSSWHQPS